jgi:hypothetical protein
VSSGRTGWRPPGQEEALQERQLVESPVPARRAAPLEKVVHRSLWLEIFSGGGGDRDRLQLWLRWDRELL